MKENNDLRYSLVNEWLRYACNVVQCAHLNPYGIAVRYPNELSPNEEMVNIAIHEAQNVYDFCLNKIKIDV